MHDVVHREADYNDHSDGLGDTQLPVLEDHDCNDAHDYEHDTLDRIQGNQKVSRGYQQDNEG